MRFLLLLAPAAAVTTLLLAGSAAAAVPMFNATCPGGVEVHADEGGPVYVDGREAALKKFNDGYYEARDPGSATTVSITRSPDGGVQLSYTGQGGANGVCDVAAAPMAGHDLHDAQGAHAVQAAAPASDSLAREVTCESRDRKQTECDMDTRGEVRLVRQLSDTRCEQGQSWGLYKHAVWVKDGCRAVFRNVSAVPSAVPAAAGDMLLGACNARAGAQGAQVTRVPVNAQVTELIVDYPDGRYLCMVGNEGAVQSLTRLRVRR